MNLPSPAGLCPPTGGLVQTAAEGKWVSSSKQRQTNKEAPQEKWGVSLQVREAAHPKAAQHSHGAVWANQPRPWQLGRSLAPARPLPRTCPGALAGGRWDSPRRCCFSVIVGTTATVTVHISERTHSTKCQSDKLMATCSPCHYQGHQYSFLRFNSNTCPSERGLEPAGPCRTSLQHPAMRQQEASSSPCVQRWRTTLYTTRSTGHSSVTSPAHTQTPVTSKLHSLPLCWTAW